MSEEKALQSTDGHTLLPEPVSRADAHRAVAEIHGAIVSARKFPRDTWSAENAIRRSCKRFALANKAIFSYPRGKTLIKGPTIRLAEAVAQLWGNMDFGIRELSRKEGESEVEAYAWDLETNTRSTRVFRVAHLRVTKLGSYALTDPRDIYEMMANQGARRMRACIQAVIPADVWDTAIEQVSQTIAAGRDNETIDERIKKMVKAFDGVGVPAHAIEERLGHPLANIVPEEIVDLQSIYVAIKENHTDRAKFFDLESSASEYGAAVELNKEFGPQGGIK